MLVKTDGGVVAARVWAVARDFNGYDACHPFIAESHIEDGLTTFGQGIAALGSYLTAPSRTDDAVAGPIP